MMSSLGREKLYALLPAIYRLRDAEHGEPLRALLSVIETELSRVERDTVSLYDNWFIETCAEWVVPYIGDLLAIAPELAVVPEATSLRPFVANTLGHRRRKGTLSGLEGLARDATGWSAVAVEFFRRLPATQNLNHLDLRRVRTPDLRDSSALELLNGPFEQVPHFVDVRRITTGDGRYNLPNIGIFLWRLSAFVASVTQIGAAGAIEGYVPATPDGATPTPRFRMSPLGRDMPLFNPRRTATGRETEVHVPSPLRPRPLHDELEMLRAALHEGEHAALSFFDPPPFRIKVGGEAQEIPVEQIQICDLSDWSVLPPNRSVTLPDGSLLVTRVAVDPKLGRLAFVDGTTPDAVQVTYAYGFAAEIGGGFYPRPAEPPPAASLKLYEVKTHDPLADRDTALDAALAQWAADGKPDAIIEIVDAGNYSVPALEIPSARKLEIRSKDGVRAHLKPQAPWAIKLNGASRLDLVGLLVSNARLTFTSSESAEGHAQNVQLAHCTLDPLTSGIDLASGSDGRLVLHLRHSISGSIDMSQAAPDSMRIVHVTDSVIDAGTTTALNAINELTVERSTIFGASNSDTLSASDAIFDGLVTALRTQTGCVRYSYVKHGSKVPRAYHCQPALALSRANGNSTLEQLALARIVPEFVSRTYGDPHYARLTLDSPLEIRTGASNESEMGVYQHLLEPQRLSNLRQALDDSVRFGLEAGHFFVT